MYNFSSKLREDGYDIANYSEYLSEDFVILLLLLGEVFFFFQSCFLSHTKGWKWYS